MATRTTRRTSTGSTRSRARKPTTAQTVARSFTLPPHVARSLIGLFFLVVGAITLIALLFPQAGLLNRTVEPTSDLYSVGIVLFEALTGRPAFDGGSVGEVLRQHLAARPKLRSGGVEVPRALEELVGRLLQTDPTDRYQSAESALADLRALDEAISHGEAEPELVTGAHDQRRSLAEPSFVGRHEELAVLERELERERQGVRREVHDRACSWRPPNGPHPMESPSVSTAPVTAVACGFARA
jgi:serine/threonine protein kinase